MLITKQSALSGKTHTKDIIVTQEQIDAWKGGMMIQDAMPNVSDDDREFLLTGITPDEWNGVFPHGDDG